MFNRPVRNIVMVKLRTLGDVLTTFPLIRAFKELFPQARLTFIADEEYQELFASHPRVDDFWGHPAKKLRQGGLRTAWRHHGSMVKALRLNQTDLYVDLYGSLRTALWGAMARIPVRMGFNLRGRKYFYTHTITAQHRYVVDLNLQFAEALGWQGTERGMEFFLQPSQEAAVRKQDLAPDWDTRRPWIVVSPGGGWPLKCWAPERFGRVAKRLVQHTGCQVCITGTAAERPRMEACARALDAPAQLLAGISLQRLAAVIKASRLFLGNDSGPKYFAEAFGVPTLICYGPTDFINNNPSHPRHRVAYRDVPCRPCHSEVCRMPRRICLDDLDEDQVVGLALKLWK